MNPSRQLKGYLMVGGTALMFGAGGVFIRIATLPASTLLMLRMAVAAAMIAMAYLGRRWWRQIGSRRLWLRLLALGVIDAAQLYTFILAVRYMDVALAVFLSYLAPVYIAIVTPRLLKQRIEPVVLAAIVLSVAGILVMLGPGLFDPSLRVSAAGVACGLASGLLLAVFFLFAKTLRNDVSGSTIALTDCIITALLMLPLGLAQWSAAGFTFTSADLWAVLGLAVFSTALGGTIFLHGMRYIRVQHTSIVGLLEPASAPLFAFVFLGEQPAVWTLLGGGFILAGAVLVVLFGKGEEGMAGSRRRRLRRRSRERTPSKRRWRCASAAAYRDRTSRG